MSRPTSGPDTNLRTGKAPGSGRALLYDPEVSRRPTAATPLIRSLLGRYFDADPKAPLEAWREEAARHPMFFLTPVTEPVPNFMHDVTNT